MKKRNNRVRKILIIVCSIILVFIVSTYVYIYFFGKSTLMKYKYTVYPNTYIAKNEVSGMSDRELSTYIDSLENDIKSIKLNITVDSKNYNYTLGDLGVYIDKDELINKVLKNEYNKTLYTSIKRLKDGRDKYSYKIIYNDNSVKDFVNNLKKQVDIESLSGSLQIDNNNNVSYEGDKVGFSLDKDKVIEQVKSEMYKTFKNKDVSDINVINIKALGKRIDSSDAKLKSINTKISSYSTRYYNTDGSINLKKAAEYIDKVVVMPNEEFSFFDYVGPYDKYGYVIYDKLIGNGVCQVSSTLYNAIMLAGIKATDRSPHAEKQDYVMGGMDAMVTSVDGKSSTDFKFINTLDYPIYISSYVDNDYLYIDIWSNDKATYGKTYEIESINRGNNIYDIYLYTYRNNQIINNEYLYSDSYKN